MMGDELNLNDGPSTESPAVNIMSSDLNCAPSSTDSVISKNTESRDIGTPQEGTENLQNETYIYREDVVRSSKRDDMIGVVMEVPGDSDSDGDVTDESDVEDGEDEPANGDQDDDTKDVGDNDDDNKDSNSSVKKDPLADGEVLVMWLDGTETTDSLTDLVVVDRSFLHGDIVASIKNPTGQLGLVLDVSITVDLLSPTGEVIQGVSTTDLTHIRKFTVGDYVVHGPWLGRVEDVIDNVTVLFDDGSTCKVIKADPSQLKPVSRSIIDDSGVPYYPGQRVRASSSSVFKGSRWLSGSWKASRLEGTISRVEAGSVFVYWISSSNLDTGANPAKVPPEEQNPKNLTLLSCFAYANWQLGEWCLFSPPQVSSSISTCDETTLKKNEASVDQCKDVQCKDQQSLAVMNPNVKVQAECNSEEPQMVNAPDALVSENLENGCAVESLPEEKLEEKNQPESIATGLLDVENKRSDGTDTLPEDHCALLNSKESTRENRPFYRKKLRKVFVKRETKGHKKDEPFERAYHIVNITTKVDVAWQNGTREYGLDSKSLFPISSPGDQEFFPEQYVVEKAYKVDDTSDMKRVGVVTSANAMERTARVRWLKPVSRPEDPREFDVEEVVSAYELEEHPDYDYCYGDVVIRLSPVTASFDSPPSGSAVEEPKDHIDPTQEETKMSNKDSEHEEDQVFNNEIDSIPVLSWVGHITGLQDGDIEVTWADGMVSKVGPQAIYVVGRDDDDTFDGGSEYSDGASWETVEDNDMVTRDTAEEDSVLHPHTDDIIENENNTHGEDGEIARNGPFSSAIGFVTRLASGIFSRGKNSTDHSESNENDADDTESQEEDAQFAKGSALDESSSQESDVVDPSDAHVSCAASITDEHSLVPINNDEKNKFGEDAPDGTVSNSTIEYQCDDLDMFKHFDITKDPFDHYFLGGSGQASGGKKWVKKVQQEWNILDKNLPDAIYVRVFEDRMDLLRAVIIGACGTPYQDGLFFFDFYLPPEYPQVPPTAYYHSGGLRINPNLYEDGKVCLSLLNTWTGKGNEVWEPSSSSILQVLVSLQGLVLNSKPYFNEAGYEKQIGTVEGEKNCLPYNENTFLLNLKSMMYILRRPPSHFEEFVKEHFRRRGHFILKACDAYMKGCLVGSLTKDACLSEESNRQSCSVGFKLMLAKILPRLFTALTEVGADCKQFEHLQRSGNVS